jgi:hypothetical protein
MTEMKKILFVFASSVLFVLFARFGAPFHAASFADESRVVGFTASWRNMSLMGPGSESSHKIFLYRDSVVLTHEVEYNHGQTLKTIRLYGTEDDLREEFFKLIESASAEWDADYTARILDGSSWRVRLTYGDGSVKTVEGYGAVPPRSDEIERMFLNLAAFELIPKMF